MREETARRTMARTRHYLNNRFDARVIPLPDCRRVQAALWSASEWMGACMRDISFIRSPRRQGDKKKDRKERGRRPISYLPLPHTHTGMNASQLQDALTAIVLAIANEKGGTGKTTLTALFLMVLSMLGYDVVGVDMDPQGHLGLCFGYPRTTIQEGIYELMWRYNARDLRTQAPIKRIIHPTYYDGSYKIFDPRRPRGDELSVALRKVTQAQLEAMVRACTEGLLEPLFSSDDPLVRAALNDSQYPHMDLWYTLQARIAEVLAERELAGGEDNAADARVSAVFGQVTHQLYTASDWYATQARIDDIMWESLQQRINAETTRRGPDLIPITADAGNADYVIRGSHEYWGEQLRYALLPIVKKYHYVFIDCPPSIQTLTINALNASDYVAIPLTPETLNLEGMVGLLSVVEQAQARSNTQLKTAGIILNKMQTTWSAHKGNAQGVRTWERGERVFATEIKQNAPVVNSLENQSLVVLDQAENPYAKAYWYLLNDLLAVVGGPARDDVAQVVANMREQDQLRAEGAAKRKKERLAKKATTAAPVSEQ